MVKPEELTHEQLIDYVTYLQGEISTYRCALYEVIDCEGDYETAVQIANEALEGEW